MYTYDYFFVGKKALRFDNNSGGAATHGLHAVIQSDANDNRRAFAEYMNTSKISSDHSLFYARKPVTRPLTICKNKNNCIIITHTHDVMFNKSLLFCYHVHPHKRNIFTTRVGLFHPWTISHLLTISVV